MAQQPEAKSIPVNRILWESLESVLLANSKELIKEIAKTLNQPEKPLLDAFRKDTKNLYLVELDDPTDERFLCEALVFDKEVAQRCRKAVVYGDRFCPLHPHWTPPPCVSKLPSLKRIKTSNDTIYFLCELTQIIYSQSYERVGLFKENKIILFEVDEDV